jgi:hypothetical protein
MDEVQAEEPVAEATQEEIDQQEADDVIIAEAINEPVAAGHY